VFGYADEADRTPEARYNSAMDPALAALVGVAVGGGLTFGVEVYRTRSSRAHRHEDLRRGAYTRLLTGSARIGYEATMVARRVADEFKDDGTPPLDPGLWPDGLARQSASRFAEMSDDLTLVYEGVGLLSPPTSFGKPAS
jgi:hypothetical protein